MALPSGFLHEPLELQTREELEQLAEDGAWSRIGSRFEPPSVSFGTARFPIDFYPRRLIPFQEPKLIWTRVSLPTEESSNAVYGEYEASVEIESERVHGQLPRRALALVLGHCAGIPPRVRPDHSFQLTITRASFSAASRLPSNIFSSFGSVGGCSQLSSRSVGQLGGSRIAGMTMKYKIAVQQSEEGVSVSVPGPWVLVPRP